MVSAISIDAEKKTNRFERGVPKHMVLETDTSTFAICKIVHEQENMLVYIDFAKGTSAESIISEIRSKL